MFAKPYKLKSTNSLKNSEKKHLAQRILDEFQNATEEKVKELVPVKASTSCLKLVLHSGEIVAVYAVDNLPMIIETETGLVPTVCALWKVPDLVPSITIHSPVLGKILGGAPLYLPGVVVPPQGVGFPRFSRGAVISANTADNGAAGLIGRAVITSGDMLMRNAGVCMETVHVYGDLLCKEPKFSKVERPRFNAVSYSAGDSPEHEQLANSISEISLQPQPTKLVKEEWPSLVRAPAQHAPVPIPLCPTADSAPEVVPIVPHVVNAPKVIPDGDDEDQPGDVFNDSVNSETLEADEFGAPPDMDGLLRWCLLCWIKMYAKSIELPLKTNLLYKNHLFPLCPPDRALDVKKSTYKKMGKFLEAMQREGIVEVKEIDKGVDAIVSVNISHPAVRAIKLTDELKEQLATAHAHANTSTNEDENSEHFVAPSIRDMLCVTAAVIHLFPVKKGTALTLRDVRKELQHYVKQRNLASEQKKGHVVLDQLLAKIAGKQEQESITWDVLVSSVCGRMTAATELRWPDGDIKLLKTRLEPITMQVVTRSGNKKVTLVNNLEAYGFRLSALSVICQRSVGASCGVTRSPGAKCDQLMLQGDQTHFVAKLLIEKYGLPKKFLEGADKALNKKK